MVGLEAWLTGGALQRWWRQGADHQVGGFHDALDQSGQPTGSVRRARVIARQTWVYASAALSDPTEPWRDAASHGLDFMIRRQTRSDGLLLSTLASDGSPAGPEVKLYDQAFAILAFAAAAAAGLAPDLQAERALRVLTCLEDDWRAPSGGYVEREVHAYQSNPHMHLFEAALAWQALGSDKRWSALADKLADLALTRFVDPNGGFLREVYDADWRPGAGDPGREVWPGHQFEWSWLLARWADHRGRSDAAAVARHLFEIGRRYGVDGRRGVAVDALDDEMAVVRARARLWPQTERIKAAAILGEADEVELAAAGLAKYLTTPAPGLWWDKMLENGDFVDEPAPASSLYHIACSIWEAKARGHPV